MNQPKEIAASYIKTAEAKVTQKWYVTLVYGILAGIFIALAGALSTIAGAGFSGTQALLIKGAVFPLGLILVVTCGAELFTGNCLLIAPLMSKKIKVTGLLKNWGLAYAGNFIGSIIVAVLVVYSHVYDGGAALATVSVAAAKCNAGYGYTVLRGVLCNMLVCLAVWSAMSSKSSIGKILAVYMPVFAFVVCGFEHSIANMFYITSGLMTSAEYGITAAGLNFGSGLWYSLIASTLGNIVGGGLIALLYWATCFRSLPAEDVSTKKIDCEEPISE